MAVKETLFTVAGITTHSGVTASGVKSERTKVRYGTDLIRLIKMLNNPKKIYDHRLQICLLPQRVDFVELPNGMLKADALKFLQAHADFQSPEDQATIQEEIAEREPKQSKPRAPKAPKAAISLDSIKSRAKKSAVTAEQIVAALTPQ
jgi:hypothetical protein